MSELVIAVILGVVEGLTEFLPVSSTGHLILVNEALAFTGERAHTFDIFIQLAAILAVAILYWRRFRDLFAWKSRSGFSGFNGLAKIGAACLPAFVLGALLHSHIKALLFSPAPVACALLAGGAVMIWLERRRCVPTTLTLESLSMRQAFFIGCFQCFALWPGMSRSASTIIGAMLVRCDRIVAAEFSFLVAVPVMCAAVGFDLLKSHSVISRGDLPLFAVGFVVSFLTALLAIKFFMSLLRRWTLEPFGWYRIALGLVVLIVLLPGWIR